MRTRAVAVLALGALVAAACGNSSSSAKPPTSTTRGSSTTAGAPAGKCPHVDAPGVSDTEIRMGGVTSKTNPLGGLYANAGQGVQAYFDMVNSQGGVYCRKLVLASQRDDAIANNKAEVDALINQDNVFVALPIATILSFSGAPDLVKAGVPTFGWAINDEWTGPPNLFGHVGAYCNGASCPPGVELPWLAKHLRKHHVGVIAYSVPNSAQCADGLKKAFDFYGKGAGADVAFLDKTLAFGATDLSADVQHMVDKKVDFVLTCVDQNGALTLAREMRKQGLNAVMYLPNANDQDFLDTYGSFFEGSYVLAQEAPLGTRPVPPGLADYVKWMDKAGYKKVENAEIGWVNAAQLVEGLRLAGPDFSREKVIQALNSSRTPFDAGGMIAPIDWRVQHTDTNYSPSCNVLLKVHNSKLDPAAFGNPGKPFICFAPAQPTSVDSVQVSFKA